MESHLLKDLRPQNQVKSLDILIGDSTGKKYAKPLILKDNLSGEKVKVEGSNASARLMSLETFSEIVLAYAQLGNKKCQALVFACFSESLERRADKAFDVARSEEEYNQRLEQRLKGKATRRTLTDAIKTYIEANNLENTNYAKFIYSNISDRLNLGIFNRRSHRLKEDWDLKPTENIRDYLNKDELRWLEQCEDLAMRLIDLDAFEPLKAMNEAIERLRIPSVRR